MSQKVEKTKIIHHTDRVVLAKWHPFYPIILSTSADKTARIFAPRKFIEAQEKN